MIVLKFMSYIINSDLPIFAKKLQTPAQASHNVQSGSTAWIGSGWVASNVTNVIIQVKSRAHSYTYFQQFSDIC